MPCRFPAEWEPQDGVLVAWPHADSDWQPLLAEVDKVYLDVVTAITRFERCLIATPEPKRIEALLDTRPLQRERIHLFCLPTNDTWARDFGPITVYDDNLPLLLDFGFNGWGLKFASNHDNQITRRLHEQRAFGDTPRQVVGLIMEGGSLESDGQGTLLTTSECLENPNRNPHLDREQIETALHRHLGAAQVLWLENGYLAGDDTDSHIDTLARLCPDDTILYQGCDDNQDEHFAALQRMQAELQALRTRAGMPFHLIELPWPQAHFDADGQRLPATYANYLVINDAVLAPTYADPRDALALQRIGEAFPGREIIGIDCRPLIEQHGSLHCITMQIPEGVLP